MGLGKTIQAAVFVSLLKTRQSVRGPVLVVAPLSTLIHWQREFASWTDVDAVNDTNNYVVLAKRYKCKQCRR